MLLSPICHYNQYSQYVTSRCKRVLPICYYNQYVIITNMLLQPICYYNQYVTSRCKRVPPCHIDGSIDVVPTSRPYHQRVGLGGLTNHRQHLPTWGQHYFGPTLLRARATLGPTLPRGQHYLVRFGGLTNHRLYLPKKKSKRARLHESPPKRTILPQRQ